MKTLSLRRIATNILTYYILQTAALIFFIVGAILYNNSFGSDSGNTKHQFEPYSNFVVSKAAVSLLAYGAMCAILSMANVFYVFVKIDPMVSNKIKWFLFFGLFLQVSNWWFMYHVYDLIKKPFTDASKNNK